MVVTSNELTDSELQELQQCEAILDRMPSFEEIGRALQVIRDKRLYRATHGTFEAYCRERRNMARSRAYQLVDAAQVAGNLSTMVDKPTHERQVRPLVELKPDQQREAWSRAIELAGGEQPTSRQVQEAARERLPATEPPSLVEIITRLESAIWSIIDRCPTDFRGTLASKLRHAADAISAPVELHHTNGHTNGFVPTNGHMLSDEDKLGPPLTYGSVCSGIEAATVAWEPLGWKPAWFAEIAEFPSAVLKERYPEVPNFGDFTTIGENAPLVDLLVGGTPCQSFSIQGLRKGLDDDRGKLAFEFLRLAERTRPRWVLWENVGGVLSIDGGRAFGSLLGGLAELGYGFAYRVLDARHFGRAQRRRRVFVVGHLGGAWQRAAAVLFERWCLSPDSRSGREVQAEMAPRASGHLRDSDCGRPAVYGWTGDESPKHGLNVTPTMRSQQGGEGYGLAMPPDVVRRFTPLECERLLGFKDDYTKIPFRDKADPVKSRLAALGNSMAVPCMTWIGRRIQYVDSLEKIAV